MSAFVIFGVLAALLLMEYLSVGARAEKLLFHCSADRELTEPGGVVTVTACVTNSSALPRLFVRVWMFFGEGVALREDKAWADRYRDRGYPSLCIRRRLSLMPHTTAVFKVRLSFSERGVHGLGRYILESGDFLGLRTLQNVGKMEPELVVTANRAEGLEQALPLNGLLGDHSVRRLLYEDPTLIVGARDYSGREPMRSISWTQTAIRGKLMVRTYDHTAEPSAVILTDLGGKQEEKEAVLALTRSVCEALQQASVPYALFSDGDLFKTDTGLGPAHLDYILERIGRARPTEFSGFRDLTERCLEERGSAADWILIVPSRSEEIEGCLRRIEARSGGCARILFGEDWQRTGTEGEEGSVWKLRPAS